MSDNLGVTKKESDAILALWRKSFPTLNDYLERSGKQAVMNLCSRTFSGRRRLFEKPNWDKAKQLTAERFKEDGKNPLLITSKDIGRVYAGMFSRIERQGKNTPIQGGNIDIAKVSIGSGFDANGASYLWQRLETEFKSYLVSFVHDEVVVEAPPEMADAVREFIGDCIRRAGAEFMKRVTMESEGTVADCWSK